METYVSVRRKSLANWGCGRRRARSGKSLDSLLLPGSGGWHLDRGFDNVERDDGDFFMQWIGCASEMEDPQVIEAKIL
jgi:hypothetical protein